ncbi:lysophospholipid acyltransferase family protein [Caulobacter sp. S45]|uniref:lysophospholipid acyltransferase family protein n=1 Tax=Caulobacter sp. S45 TaxID=1641861 RepID=UPI001575BF3C|nr:lysophospholipid acyltransferase family protein [Caulobacter sp. S45]
MGPARDALPEVSPLLLHVFGRLFARDLARSFHAVRRSGDPPSGSGPLVVYANHPSWWDGELFVWLAACVFCGQSAYTPMEAAMLERYRFFGRIGGIGIAPGYAGAATFLAMGRAVLGREDGLWLVNAEGRFRDVRERPIRVAPGLAHLARWAPAARFVPLAIEYAFWNERRPNLLLRFGDAIPANAVRTEGSAALNAALEGAMDALAVDAALRDPGRFTTLIAGRTQISPVYDGWRRLRARVQGRRFDPAHGAGRDASA